MNLIVHEYGNPTNPAIIFLHGLGVSSWMWQDQIEKLENHYYCLAVDLPGSGESYQAEWHSFADTAVQVADIIRQKTVTKKAHVVGLSLGGYAALTLLANHADVVESAIASGVTIRPFPNQWLYKPLFRVMGHLSRTSLVINLMMRTMQLPDETKPLYRRDSKRVTPETSRRVYTEVINFTIPTPLNNNKRPLLVVAGEKEAKLICDSLPDFNQVPETVTAVAPNAHHGWNGELPDLFTDMITAWAEQRPLPDNLTLLGKESHKTQLTTA